MQIEIDAVYGAEHHWPRLVFAVDTPDTPSQYSRIGYLDIFDGVAVPRSCTVASFRRWARKHGGTPAPDTDKRFPDLAEALSTFLRSVMGMKVDRLEDPSLLRQLASATFEEYQGRPSGGGTFTGGAGVSSMYGTALLIRRLYGEARPQLEVLPGGAAEQAAAEWNLREIQAEMLAELAEPTGGPTAPVVHRKGCTICEDPDYAAMGLPLCRKCPKCGGHIAADDCVCDDCGFEEPGEDE